MFCESIFCYFIINNDRNVHKTEADIGRIYRALYMPYTAFYEIALFYLGQRDTLSVSLGPVYMYSVKNNYNA